MGIILHTYHPMGISMGIILWHITVGGIGERREREGEEKGEEGRDRGGGGGRRGERRGEVGREEGEGREERRGGGWNGEGMRMKKERDQKEGNGTEKMRRRKRKVGEVKGHEYTHSLTLVVAMELTKLACWKAPVDAVIATSQRGFTTSCTTLRVSSSSSSSSEGAMPLTYISTYSLKFLICNE